MRFYFTDNELLHHLESSLVLKDINIIRRIYSSDGILHVVNNILQRVIINDVPVEKITINNHDFIVDRSTIKYETGFFQISPKHIGETVTIRTYTIANAIDPNAIDPNAIAIDPNEIKLVIEKHSNNIIEIYFLTDSEKHISTFLSSLNLC
uniref:Uncharacterized protein n=1 Tax=viral metagenome TaxID=1070528 RepID=A0A6C0IHP1_9ZZZZ